VPPPLIEGIAGSKSASLNIFEAFVLKGIALKEILRVFPPQDGLLAGVGDARSMCISNAAEGRVRVLPPGWIFKWDDYVLLRHRCVLVGYATE
jgi:hypothetical protein